MAEEIYFNKKYLSALRDFSEMYAKMVNSGMLGAYLGLYKVKVANGENPEECLRVRQARYRFLVDEYEKFSSAIKTLAELELTEKIEL